MTKKTMVALIVAIGLLVAGAMVFAEGPGYGGWGGRGMMGPGYGGGYGGHGMMGRGMMGPGYGWNYGTDGKFDQETAKLRTDLFQKHQELNNVLAAPKVDEAKAKALQTEINKLENELGDKMLAARLEFQKNNPNVAQGYGPGSGSGWGPGSHMGYGRGMGYGPGACRQ